MLSMNYLATAVTVFSIFSSSLQAEEDKAANFGGPNAVENQIAADDEQQRPGFKEQLAADGVQLGLDYSAISMRASDVLPDSDDNANSGMLRFYGSWEAVGQGTKNSGALVWKIEHRHSYTDTPVKDLELGAGALGLAGPPFSDEKTRLTNLYWRQRLMDGSATIVAGFLDVTDFVDVYALASPWTGFSNLAFSTGAAAIALPGDATLGVAGGMMLSEQTYMIAALTDMNSDPTKPLDGFDSFFNDNKYFKSVELGWTKSQKEIYTDNVHVTFWHADVSEQMNQAKDKGINFSASGLINDQWLPFLRGGWNDSGSLLGIESSISAGFGYYGLGGNENSLGVAVNWSDVVGGDAQHTMELYYLIKPLPYLEITPDIQLIKDPALNSFEDKIVMYGLRLRLAM